MSKQVEIGALKTNSVIMIEGEPCRVVSIEKSKPGKHGSAKARVVAIGIFDDVKRSIVSPADSMIESPLVNKRRAQVITVSDMVQLMDSETYEVFETTPPKDEDLRVRLEPGVEVEYWLIAGKKKIVRTR
ncbi:MAG: translation initiation factor IF-5A [Candidatus Geothermarchaeales archaeon]